MRMRAATRGLSKWIKATTLIASVWRRYLVLAKTPIGKLLRKYGEMCTEWRRRALRRVRAPRAEI